MMLANDLKTYYDEVRRYLDCPKREQNRLLSRVNRQVIELQANNPNLDYDGIINFLEEPQDLAHLLMQDVNPDALNTYKKLLHLKKNLFITFIVAIISLSFIYVYFSVSYRVDPKITEEKTIYIEDDTSSTNDNQP